MPWLRLSLRMRYVPFGPIGRMHVSPSSSRAPHAAAAPRFLIMTIVSGSVATAILFTLNKIGVSVEMALVLTSMAVPMANYLAAEFFVFRSPA